MRGVLLSCGEVKSGLERFMLVKTFFSFEISLENSLERKKKSLPETIKSKEYLQRNPKINKTQIQPI